MFTKVREQFRKNILHRIDTGSKDAVTCPCCEHSHRVYHRSINSGMAKGLIAAFRARNLQHFHAHDLLNDHNAWSGDFTKLRFWGFIERATEIEGLKGKTNGYWRITAAGVEFIHGRTSAVKFLHILDDCVEKNSGGYVTISTCLGNKFSYRELMGFV